MEDDAKGYVRYCKDCKIKMYPSHPKRKYCLACKRFRDNKSPIFNQVYDILRKIK